MIIFLEIQTWSKMNKKTFQIFSKSDYISFGYSQVNMGESTQSKQLMRAYVNKPGSNLDLKPRKSQVSIPQSMQPHRWG